MIFDWSGFAARHAGHQIFPEMTEMHGQADDDDGSQYYPVDVITDVA